jgi:hypothetical protein
MILLNGYFDFESEMFFVCEWDELHCSQNTLKILVFVRLYPLL